jgi:hypothetical protein
MEEIDKKYRSAAVYNPSLHRAYQRRSIEKFYIGYPQFRGILEPVFLRISIEIIPLLG